MEYPEKSNAGLPVLLAPPKPSSVEPAKGCWSTLARIPVPFASRPKPGVCVMVAGFQNIEDNAPPAAMPANASPCPTVLCSRTANAPAFASVAAIGMRTAAPASNAAQPDLTVFAPMFALPPASHLGRLRFASVAICRHPFYYWGRNRP